MEHRNLKLSESVAQSVKSNTESFKKSGISETLDGVLENYKGVRSNEEVSFEGVEGMWHLKKVTPNTVTKRTQFDFTFSQGSSSQSSSRDSSSQGSSRDGSSQGSRSSDNSSQSSSSQGSSSDSSHKSKQ